jgi:hypothetical protein
MRYIIKGSCYPTTAPNGTKLSYICMNPGHEPVTVGNDTP